MPRRNLFNPANLSGRNILRRKKMTTQTHEEQIQGSGLLLEPGLGAAFSSVDEMSHLTNKPIIGLGLSQISEKLKSMKNEKFAIKPKSISFTL